MAFVLFPDLDDMLKLKLLIDRPDLRKFGKNGRSIVLSRFSNEIVRRAFTNLEKLRANLKRFQILFNIWLNFLCTPYNILELSLKNSGFSMPE